MVSHSFSDRCHPSASFSVSLFNEFAAGRNARRTTESVLLVSSQSIIERGDIGSRRLSRNVISSEVEKSSLPCGYPCQCENENRRLCVSFPCCITSAVMGLPERSLGCARDDETGSGWFLTRFQIAAIHPLSSVCPSSTSSQRGGMPEGLRRAFFSYRQHYPSGEGCDTRIPSSKKGGEAATRALNPEPNESIVKRGCEEMRIHFFTAPSCLL